MGRASRPRDGVVMESTAQQYLATAGQVVGTGFGSGADAVFDAVANAVAALGERRPALVLVFPPGRMEPDGALAQAESAAEGASVAGMTSDGVIGADGLLACGCAAIAFDDSAQTGLGVAGNAAADPRAAGYAAAAEALQAVDVGRGHPVVLVFLDPDSADYGEVVAGVYDVTGAQIPIVGGGANAALGDGPPLLFANGRVCRDSVVVAALVSERPVGIGIAHGCQLVGVPAIVTRSDGHTIMALDGRPAAEAYLDAIGVHGDVDDAQFERLATLHPLAQLELKGRIRLRHIRRRTPEGGLCCVTAVPENAAVVFTEQSLGSIAGSARVAVRDAIAELRGPARAALVFECAARRRIYADGEALSRQIEALTSSFATDCQLVGVYTRGEVGRVRGAVGDLNHVVVVVAFG